MSRADTKHLALLVMSLALGGVGCSEEGALPVTYTPPALPPSIQDVSASPESVGPGELLNLGVTARVPHSALSFSWTTTTGFVSTPESGADSSSTVWMSPSCLPADVTPTVTVTVTDSLGRSASHTFPVKWTGPACTRPLCAFSLEKGRLAATADCITDSTLFIPDAYTFDGQDKTVTVVDPPGTHFTGAVIRNRGSTAYVRGVTITASNLRDSCEDDVGDEPRKLRGILLEGASGEVVDSKVMGLAKASGMSGCQDGAGIEVRNDDASGSPLRVDVLRNFVSGYQKLGILATGAVEVTLQGNTVEGSGPVDFIARNGIQISDGARAQVTKNKVSGNAYSAPGPVSVGLLVRATPDKPVTGLVVEDNSFIDNDGGIYLTQDPAGLPDPSVVAARISNNVLQNGTVSHPDYQAAIVDYYGTGSVITSNDIKGDGYDPKKAPDRTFAVDVYTTEPASKLSFLTPKHDVTRGSCSGKLTVQSQDPVGNLVPSSKSFALMAEGPVASGVTFHAMPDCSDAPMTSVNLSNPQAEATFFFKSSQPGSVTVRVSDGGELSTTQEQLIH